MRSLFLYRYFRAVRYTIFLILSQEVCQIYFGRLLCTNLWRKICKWLNDSDKLTGCFLPRPPSVPMKCPEWSCYLKLSRYLKLNECRLLTALIWSYNVIWCLYGPMNRKINPETLNIALSCFHRWSLRALCEIALESTGGSRVKAKGARAKYFLKKKWSVSQFEFLDKTGRFVNVGVKIKGLFGIDVCCSESP